MQCQTVRPGVECFFWKKSGCSHQGNSCNQIVEQCQGCSNIIEFEGEHFCRRYPNPEAKWLIGKCNLATHIQIEEPKVEQKAINPLKASKRMARQRK